MMDHKYRKKPVIIEAFQMTKKRRQDKSEWPDWLREAWNKPPSSEGAVWAEWYLQSDGTDRIRIRTLEGGYVVSWNDWIIKGVQGELYPCKPDIFEQTYEKYMDN